jgi:hypothetical protein
VFVGVARVVPVRPSGRDHRFHRELPTRPAAGPTAGWVVEAPDRSRSEPGRSLGRPPEVPGAVGPRCRPGGCGPARGRGNGRRWRLNGGPIGRSRSGELVRSRRAGREKAPALALGRPHRRRFGSGRSATSAADRAGLEGDRTGVGFGRTGRSSRAAGAGGRGQAGERGGRRRTFVQRPGEGGPDVNRLEAR